MRHSASILFNALSFSTISRWIAGDWLIGVGCKKVSPVAAKKKDMNSEVCDIARNSQQWKRAGTYRTVVQSV